jgi:hypothetical protein
MTTYIVLEISWDQIEWNDVLKLLQVSGCRNMIEVFRSGARIFASTHALRFGDSRDAWLSDAQRLQLSTSFIALAEWAAENGISMICTKRGLDIDPEVPFQHLPGKEGSEVSSDSTKPPRLVICEEANGGFRYPHDEDLVRWIADWQRMEVIVAQVLGFGEKGWVDARADVFGDIEEKVDRVGYLADPEAWDLVLSDELPEWGRQALSRPIILKGVAKRYL